MLVLFGHVEQVQESKHKLAPTRPQIFREDAHRLVRNPFVGFAAQLLMRDEC